jgi:hypothetical protein
MLLSWLMLYALENAQYISYVEFHTIKHNEGNCLLRCAAGLSSLIQNGAPISDVFVITLASRNDGQMMAHINDGSYQVSPHGQ